MKYLVVIPALNPGKELIEYVDTLLAHGYTDLLLVDDGSREDVRFIFDAVEKKPGCMVLRHVQARQSQPIQIAGALSLKNPPPLF